MRDSRRSSGGGVWCSSTSTGVHSACPPLADGGAIGGVEPLGPAAAPSGICSPRGSRLEALRADKQTPPDMRDGVGGVDTVGEAAPRPV